MTAIQPAVVKDSTAIEESQGQQDSGSPGAPPAPDVAAREEYLRLAALELDAAYRMAGYLLADGEPASAAVQAGLVRAWQYWPELIDRNRFGPWFERMVLDACLERMHHPPAASASAGEDHAPDAFKAMRGDDSLVRTVRRLSPQHRAAIAMRYWLNLSPEQIAERTGSALPAVEKSLADALTALERREAQDRLEAQKAAEAAKAAEAEPAASRGFETPQQAAQASEEGPE